jgi:hypothetical protein
MMDTTGFTSPGEDEYAPYYRTYVYLLSSENILGLLREQQRETLTLLASLTEEQSTRSYAEGKWSIKEVIGHIIDTERVFAYRGLRIARGDETPLPGFDQDDFVRGGDFNSRPLAGLAGEYEHLRTSNLFLFESWSADIQLRRGTASETGISARAIPYLIAGHERHHLDTLSTRYSGLLSL